MQKKAGFSQAFCAVGGQAQYSNICLYTPAALSFIYPAPAAAWPCFQRYQLIGDDFAYDIDDSYQILFQKVNENKAMSV